MQRGSRGADFESASAWRLRDLRAGLALSGDPRHPEGSLPGTREPESDRGRAVGAKTRRAGVVDADIDDRRIVAAEVHLHRRPAAEAERHPHVAPARSEWLVVITRG